MLLDEARCSSDADEVSVTVNPPIIGGDPHATITAYNGPSTCVACQESEAQAVHGSVHYQQSGPTDYATNTPGPAGERWNGIPGSGFSGINTYCDAHETSPRFTCAGCHVGNGRFPKTPEEFAGLDQTAHATTRKSCLNCHAGAGGGDGTKRGDMSSALIDPDPHIDYHMSSRGEGMVCADCHAAGDHRFIGRGVDLRPNDVPDRLTCTSCHEDRPHGAETTTAETVARGILTPGASSARPVTSRPARRALPPKWRVTGKTRTTRMRRATVAAVGCREKTSWLT